MTLEYRVCLDIIVQHEVFAGVASSLPNGETDPVEGRAPIFEIIPTRACRRLLEKYKLIFKPTPGGGIIVREFKLDDGNLVGTVPIKTYIPLSFYIKLSNPNLLDQTIPYKSEIQVARTDGELKLFFDSIDKEMGRNVDDEDSIVLSQETKVALVDFIGIVNNRYPIVGMNLERIEVLPMVPDAVVENVPILEDEINLKNLILEEGKYQITWRDDSGEKSVMIVANTELANSNFLGMVTIFKNELEMTGEESEVIGKKYRIPFAKYVEESPTE